MNETINSYVNSCKTTCICTVVSIVLIFIFMLSPIKRFFFSSIIGKLSILVILGYAMVNNMKTTFAFSKVVLNGDMKTVKNTNLLCGAIFSVLLFFLFLSVVRSFFYS